MKRRTTTTTSTLAVLLALLACCLVAGCSADTHGNRDNKRPLVTQWTELRHHVGKEVTLVGTARANRAGGDAAVDLRGGYVDLPAYAWPAGYADQPVSVTGTLLQRGAARDTYQLGEIKGAERWSR